jgi:hypothetical protein
MTMARRATAKKREEKHLATGHESRNTNGDVDVTDGSCRLKDCLSLEDAEKEALNDSDEHHNL